MPSLTEGHLAFHFDANWRAARYDAWKFYQDHWKDSCGGNRGVDILALDPVRCLWLVEVKDYRQHFRTKTEDLASEMARKARDTLAGLIIARHRAAEPEERELAAAALGFKTLRIVLHLEQPATHSRLFPRAIDPAKIEQKLKSLVKLIDPHPRVVELNRLERCSWQVQSLPIPIPTKS